MKLKVEIRLTPVGDRRNAVSAGAEAKVGQCFQPVPAALGQAGSAALHFVVRHSGTFAQNEDSVA